MKKGRYYLFTSESHESVRLDYSEGTIAKFLELWKANFSNKAICKELKLKQVELALIVMDLDYAGRLPERKNGFWGTERTDRGAK